MSNTVRVSGGSFESVCETAKARSLTPDYQGCSVHINARTVKTTKDEHGHWMFIVIFGISDWFSDESTIATYVNGFDRAI